MRISVSALTTLALSVVVSSAPIASPDGALGSVVDGVAPITSGVGTTVNYLLKIGNGGPGGGFPGGPEGIPGRPGGIPGGPGGIPGGIPGGPDGTTGRHPISTTVVAIFAIFAAASAAPVANPDGTLSGVVDTIAPITSGLGTTLNQILGFKDSSSGGNSSGGNPSGGNSSGGNPSGGNSSGGNPSGGK
ncbi:hypothetical protein BX070DRAFT_261656 [Coemansia spiralis]|nr:hypothetical protein BX070DRAFT_261656 [Coemansia spiralis]